MFGSKLSRYWQRLHFEWYWRYHNIFKGIINVRNFNVRLLKLRLKGVLAKNEKGYRLTAKNNRAWSLLILLLSVASIMRKLLKTKLVPKKVESIQIEKVATDDSNHKNINLISNHSDITNNSHRLIFDAFVNSCYFWF